MQVPYWNDETATLYAADPLQVLAELSDRSADCIVTSPPPWTPPQDAKQPAQRLGAEPTAALYLASLRRVLAQAHRVLTDQGTAWLITSDRYTDQTASALHLAGRHRRRIPDPAMAGMPAASLIGLPWQLAFALQDDGWVIRNAIVWHHSATEPHPADERFPRSYELIFLLVKTGRYYFDSAAAHQSFDRLAETGDPASANLLSTQLGALRGGWRRLRKQACRHGIPRQARAIASCRPRHCAASGSQRPRMLQVLPFGVAGDVWALPARPQRHTLPVEVPLRCIAAGCRPGGTVLDVFAATGTTGIAARRLGRSFIGIEPDVELCRIAEHRLSGNDHASGLA
ncbi:DNA-methyltransferase [Actinomadura sp. SCN-SB]|uniref:DNA-methyltransferase n=1 Tax=Actinomadura sp. SCN-SB TaxID=3373092 RepID=UPI0037529617